MIFKTIANPNIVSPFTFQVSAFLEWSDILANQSPSAAENGFSRSHGQMQASRRRQAQYQASRFCMEEAIKAAFCSQAAPMHEPMSRGSLWPKGLVGSLTQTGSFVSAAVSFENQIKLLGIDSEKVFTQEAIDRLWHFVLTKKEVASFEWNYRTVMDRASFITLVFSAKQSLIKAFHASKKRKVFYHDLLVLPGRDPELKEFEFELLKPIAELFPKGYCGRGRYDLRYDHIHTAVELN